MIKYEQPEYINTRQAIQWIAHGRPPCSIEELRTYDIPRSLDTGSNFVSEKYLYGALCFLSGEAGLREKKAISILYSQLRKLPSNRIKVIPCEVQDESMNGYYEDYETVFYHTNYAPWDAITTLDNCKVHSFGLNISSYPEAMNWNTSILGIPSGLTLSIENKDADYKGARALELSLLWEDVRNIEAINVVDKELVQSCLGASDQESRNDLKRGRPSEKRDLDTVLYALWKVGLIDKDMFEKKFPKQLNFLNELSDAPQVLKTIRRGNDHKLYGNVMNLLDKFQSDK